MISFLKDKEYAVKSPERKDGDAGIDFYIPKFNDAFKKEFLKKNHTDDRAIIIGANSTLCIPPHKDILIPSGYYTKFSKNIALIGHNRSSVARDKLCVLGACIDDSSYQGMLYIHLINVSDTNVYLKQKEKIAQFVPCFIDIDPIKCLSEDDISKEDFFVSKSERGEGGFGSTNS